MSSTEHTNVEKMEQALKNAIGVVSAIGFSGVAVIVFAILSFFYRENELYLTIFLSLLVFFVLAAAFMTGWLFHSYRKSIHETSAAAQEFSEQLQNFEAGRIRLSHANYRSPTLNRLQSRINNLLAIRQEERQYVQHHISSSEVMAPEEMTQAVLAALRESSSYRSAVLAVKAYGSDPIPDRVDETLLRTLRLQFQPTLVAKQENGFYYAYLPSLPAFPEFQEMCRQFVAIFSPSIIEKEYDAVTYYSARIGVAVFPFVAGSKLLSEAKNQLEKDAEPVSMVPTDSAPALPDPSFGNTPRRVIALAASERYLREFRSANALSQSVKIVTDYMTYACGEMHYDVCGFLRRDDKTNRYGIMMEENIKDGKEGFRLLATQDQIGSEEIAPLVSYCRQEAATFINDVTMLPPEVGEMLQSLGVASAVFAPVMYQNQLYGFMYYLSVQRRDEFTLADREATELSFSLISSMLVTIQEKENALDTNNLVEALLSRHGRLAYQVNAKTYRLLHFSNLVEKNFLDAKVGEYCFKALMGRDTPCEECPLRMGTVKRVIAPLGPAEQTLSMVNYRSSSKDAATILIEKQTASAVSSNLFDAKLGVFNAKALSNDLGREIRNRGTGYVVSVRLTNISDFAVKFPSENTENLRQVLVRKIQDAGYGDFTYRYDEDTLSFLLRSTSKSAMVYFAESLAEAIQAPIAFNGVSFSPAFAYSAIGYPTEAASNFEMMSMIKTELDRSVKVGDGFLLEVGRSRVRKALRKDYLRQLLDVSLRTNAVALSLSAVTETSTSHISGIQISLGLEGLYHERISDREFMPIAVEGGLVTSFDEAVLQNVGQFFDNYGDTTLKTSGIRAFFVNVSPNTLLADQFLPFMKNFMTQHRFPKDSFFLSLGCGDLAGHEETLRPVLAMLRPLGIRFAVRSYQPERIGIPALKSLGIEAVAISRDLLQDSLLSPSSTSSFIRMATSLEENNFITIANGVASQDERDFCYDMAVPYYIDGGKVHGLSTQDFITALNYQR